MLKKILQCLGTVVCSSIFGYLFWLLFYWATPYLMSIGWGLLIAYVIIAGGTIGWLIQSMNILLYVPMAFLMKKNFVAKVINALILVSFGFSSVRLPWVLDMEYNFLQYVIAICLTFTYVAPFWATIVTPFSVDADD
jgi:hypothetical protein